MASDEPGQTGSWGGYHQFIDRRHSDNYRSEEIQALVQAIRAKENRLVVGLPGMGMSNLLRFLVARPELVGRKVTFAYLNCDALDDCLDLSAFFETIARQLQEQGLRNFKMGERGYDRLKELMLQLGGDPLSRVVIVVDQANALLAAAEPSFYRKLKALTDLNKRVCYIVTTDPRIVKLVDLDGLLFAGRWLAVGRLNERDCSAAITEEARRLGIEFDSVAQMWLARLTGGHPGLLRAISSAVVAEGLNLLAAEETGLVEHLLARGDVQYRCRKLWNGLGPAEQAALQLLVAGRPDEVAPATLAWLRDLGLVDEGNEKYGLFSPIFTGFVAAEEQLSTPASQPNSAVLEPVTIVAGKVFKGAEPVTLRPLEQKLLTYLLLEPGRVHTHDEIAQCVWGTYEVTPDMITGLISQLRARLGKGYIKTHHRRGYEFIEK